MESQIKTEETKNRRKSSKPVKNWRAIGSSVENNQPSQSIGNCFQKKKNRLQWDLKGPVKII